MEHSISSIYLYFAKLFINRNANINFILFIHRICLLMYRIYFLPENKTKSIFIFIHIIILQLFAFTVSFHHALEYIVSTPDFFVHH